MKRISFTGKFVKPEEIAHQSSTESSSTTPASSSSIVEVSSSELTEKK